MLHVLSIVVAANTAAADVAAVDVEGFRVTLKSARLTQRSRPVFPGDERALPRTDLAFRFEIAPLAANEAYVVEVGQVYRGRLPDGKPFDGHAQESWGGMVTRGTQSLIHLGKFGPAPVETRTRGAEPNAPAVEADLLVEPSFVGAAPAKLAELEGDFFASKLEILDFEFPRAAFVVNAVKTIGSSRLKLIMIDEHAVGCRLGLKLDLPRRSEARTVGLAARYPGFGVSSNEPKMDFVVFARDAQGNYRSLAPVGSGVYTSIMARGTDAGPHADPLKLRNEKHMIVTAIPKDCAAIHVVCYRLLDYPRLHKFKLKDVKIDPAPPRPAPAGRKQIALGG